MEEKPELEIPKPKYKLPRPRRRRPSRPRAVLPPVLHQVRSVTACGENKVAIAFECNAMISKNKLPSTWLFGSNNERIVGIVSAELIEYTFALSGNVASGQPYVIAAMDPAARAVTGGYIAESRGNLI